MAAKEGFSRKERLRLRTEFARVYAAKRAASDVVLTVYVMENGLRWSRLGLSVGKRVGGAVRRNLIRRRIREAFRKSKAALPAGLDIVCVAKPGDPPTEAVLAESLRTLLPKAVARRPPRTPPVDKPRPSPSEE